MKLHVSRVSGNDNTVPSQRSLQRLEASAITDRRSAPLVQNKLQSLADKSAHIRQLRATIGVMRSADGGVTQAKSKVETTGQNYDWGGKTTVVGKSMMAWLEPGSLLQGESAEINTAQNPMMKAIRGKYSITGGDLVKGHLLNDNLGGKALNNNLFPITRAANKVHLLTAENYTKDRLWGEQKPLWYSVDVIGTPDINATKHAFLVHVGEWAGGTDYNDVSEPKNGGHVESDLKDVQNTEKSNIDDMEYSTANTLEEAMDDDMALEPRNRVGDMESGEKSMRKKAKEIYGTLDVAGETMKAYDKNKKEIK